MSFNPNRKKSSPPRGIGRTAEIEQINTHEAKQRALQMLRSGKVRTNSKLRNTCLLLGTAGVLLEEQILELIGLSRRTLQRYRQKRILDVVPTPINLTNLLEEEHRIWTLGPIGTALAEMLQGKNLIPKGYLESKIDRVTHDLLCNLVYYKLHLASREHQFTAILLSRYEATIHNKKGQPILEPDAMIILQSPDETQIKFLVEYHNENYSSRAAEKIRKYEHVYQEAYWEDQWHVLSFPPILIVTTHRAPAVGYNTEIQKHLKGTGVKCTYLIKPLRTLLDGSQSPLVWLNLEKNRSVNLLKI